MGEAGGRVIVATFASNIGRVQQVLDAAAAHGRKMVALGRSMEQNISIAVELGYLDPRGDTLARKDQLQRLANEELVVMTTGSQGEPMSGLTRMSNRDHRNITIEPGDTVIVFSDGVSEARNPSSEEFGDDRISSTLAPIVGQSVQVVLDTLLAAVREFAATVPQNDDITALVVRYRG